jgi:hypothetical protein
MTKTPIARQACCKLDGTGKAAVRGRAKVCNDTASLPPPETPGPTVPRLNKTDIVIAMLRSPAGASVDEMMVATGWQRHSVRGALAGAVKKKLGAVITCEVIEGVRRYRVSEASA